MRKKGLYSGQIITWRLEKKKDQLAALTEKKRGRKPASDKPFIGRLAESEMRVLNLTKRLERAEGIIHFRKNLRRYSARSSHCRKISRRCDEYC